MPNGIRYTRPPVTEALFDIQVNIDPSFHADKLDDFCEQVKDTFPVKQIQTQFQTEIKVEKSSDPVVNTVQKTNGFILKAGDNSKIVQTRLDGFTFNKLKPYNGWDHFSSEAYSLWEKYKEVTQPISVRRIALRFINLIEIPLPVGALKDYFNTAPATAPNLSLDVSEFLLRIVASDGKTKNKAIITQAIDLTKINEIYLPIIFDIDVYQEVSLEPDSKNIEEILASLREFKNSIFEESLTEKTRDLIR